MSSACNTACPCRDLTAINNRYQKPVMLTEFACGGRTAEQQLAYMQGMLPWLDSQQFMVGYAWCALFLPLLSLAQA